MDREILFKGFCEYKGGIERVFYNGEWHFGEWVTGHLLWYEDGRARITPRHTDIFIYENDKHVIVHQALEVVPETVSQYTEVCDESQAKIFENDIVLEKDENTHKEILYVVVFSYGSFVLKEIGKRLYRELFQPRGMTRRVISNKFSNPELLEEENE